MSQAAIRVLEVAAVPSSRAELDVQLLLRCGCVIRARVAAERILERPDGERFAVGKYRCPKRHPVT